MPSINSEGVVLTDIDSMLKMDAVNPLVSGYWVLDDRAYWDGGSARHILQDNHTHMQVDGRTRLTQDTPRHERTGEL
jgi:hypothetical protein